MTLVQRNLKLTVTYDGSGFFGFQYQVGVPTVQGVLEESTSAILRENVRVIGSGRTDTGVHAMGLVATVKTGCPIPVDKLRLAMNSGLPGSVRVLSIEEVPDDFHPRFSAKGKQYRYIIQPVKQFSPFLARFCCQIEDPLDLAAMQEGAARFPGEHDFSAFTRSPDRFENTRRLILDARIVQEGSALVFDVIGTGFLHNMVRNMAKALILIGLHQMKPHDIDELYRNQDRTRLGSPAPPGGLYLMKVMY